MTDKDDRHVLVLPDPGTTARGVVHAVTIPHARTSVASNQVLPLPQPASVVVVAPLEIQEGELILTTTVGPFSDSFSLHAQR